MNSNSIFLTKDKIKLGEDTTLPLILRLVQNTSRNIGSVNEENIVAKRKSQAGVIGDGFYDFTFDFTCAPIELCSEQDPFKEINKILMNKISPTFSRDYFIKNYIILEIDDYGHQSMSLGFRDFVPQIYIDGKKLWQKYVGIIRQYSKHVA